MGDSTSRTVMPVALRDTHRRHERSSTRARRSLRLLAAGAAIVLLAGCGGDKSYGASDVPSGMDDPAAARQFFGDQNLDAGDGSIGHTYEYVHERRWEAAGWQALAEALDTATTDGDIVFDPSTPGSDDAARTVARILMYVPQRDDFNELPAIMREREAGSAAEHLAHIVTTYAVALDFAPTDSRLKPGLWTPTSDAFGSTLAQVPFVDRDAVAPYLRVALATDKGFAELRAGFNQYRAQMIAAFADRAASSKVDNGLAGVTSVINDDIQLEYLVLQQIRKDPTRTTAQRNARLSAWITAGAGKLERLESIARGAAQGRPGDKMLTGVISRDIGAHTADTIEALRNPQTFPRGAPTLADTAALTEWYLFAATAERGNLWTDPAGLDVVRPGGRLLAWQDLLGMSEEDRDAFVDQLTDRDTVKGFGPVEGIYNSLSGRYTDAATPLENKD